MPPEQQFNVGIGLHLGDLQQKMRIVRQEFAETKRAAEEAGAAGAGRGGGAAPGGTPPPASGAGGAIPGLEAAVPGAKAVAGLQAELDELRASGKASSSALMEMEERLYFAKQAAEKAAASIGKGAAEAEADLKREAAAAATAAEKIKQMEAAAAAAKQRNQELQSGAGTLAAALAGIGAGGILLTKSFVDAASQMQQFRGTLAVFEGGMEGAQRRLSQLSDFAKSTPFELPGVVSAAAKIAALRQNIDEVLPLAGDLASVFQKDIPESALALSKAMAGSQDGVQQLADTYGITRQRMIQFGAAHVSTGEISVRTEEQQRKLRDALLQIVRLDYGGAMKIQMETLAGSLSNLGDSITRLRTSAGETAAPVFGAIVGAATDAVEALDQMPAAAKGAGVGIAGLVGAAGTLGAGLAGSVVAIAAVRNALDALKVSFLGIAGAAAGPVAILAAVAAAFTVMSATNRESAKTWDMLKEGMEEAGKRAEKLGQARFEDWASKSGAELKRMGVSTKDLVDAQVALQDRMEAIASDENKSEATKRRQIAALAEEKKGLHDAAAALGDYGKAVEQTFRQASMALAKAQSDLATGTGSLAEVAIRAQAKLAAASKDASLLGGTPEEQQAAWLAINQTAMDAIKQQRDLSIRGTEEVSAKRTEAAEMAVEEARALQKAHEAAGTASVADQDRIAAAQVEAARRARDAALEAIGNRQAAEAQAGTLQQSQIEAFKRERENAEREYTGKVREASAARAEARKKEYAEALQAKRDLIRAAETAVDDELAELEEKRARGVDVEAAVMAAVLEKNRIAMEAEDAEHAARMANAATAAAKAAERARHASEAAHVEAQGRLEVLEAEKRHRGVAAEAIDLRRQAAQVEASTADARIRHLENLRSHGVAVEQEMAEAIEASNEAKVRAIQLEREHALAVEQNPAKRAAIEAKAAAELARANQDAEIAAQRNHEAEMSRVANVHRAKEQTARAEADAADQALQRITVLHAAGMASEADLRKAAEDKLRAEVRGAEEKAAAERAAAESIMDREQKTERLRQIEMGLASARERAALEASRGYALQDEKIQKMISDLERLARQEEERGASPLQSFDEAFGASQFGGGFRIENFNSAKSRLAELKAAQQQKARDTSGAIPAPDVSDTVKTAASPPASQPPAAAGPSQVAVSGNVKVTFEGNGTAMSGETQDKFRDWTSSYSRDVARERYMDTGRR